MTDSSSATRFKFSRLVAALCFGLFVVANSPAETLLLTGATVHTVSGATITNGQVLVRDGKIAAVGNSVLAADARRVVLDGLHLYPGMIALNTDLGLAERRSANDNASLILSSILQYFQPPYLPILCIPTSERALIASLATWLLFCVM